MAKDIANGYKIPEASDVGSTVFDALESNIEAVSAHDHSKNKGEQIPPEGLLKIKIKVESANWQNLPGSTDYYQTVELPNGILFKDASLRVYTPDTHEPVWVPLIETENNNNSEFRIITNDNTQNYLILVG